MIIEDELGRSIIALIREPLVFVGAILRPDRVDACALIVGGEHPACPPLARVDAVPEDAVLEDAGEAGVVGHHRNGVDVVEDAVRELAARLGLRIVLLKLKRSPVLSSKLCGVDQPDILHRQIAVAVDRLEVVQSGDVSLDDDRHSRVSSGGRGILADDPNVRARVRGDGTVKGVISAAEQFVHSQGIHTGAVRVRVSLNDIIDRSQAEIVRHRYCIRSRRPHNRSDHQGYK